MTSIARKCDINYITRYNNTQLYATIILKKLHVMKTNCYFTDETNICLKD